jgi:hypothetical protein
MTFPNCEGPPSCLNHYKAIVALCGVLTSPGTKGLSWSLLKEKSPMMGSFVMPRNTVTFDVSL